VIQKGKRVVQRVVPSQMAICTFLLGLGLFLSVISAQDSDGFVPPRVFTEPVPPPNANQLPAIGTGSGTTSNIQTTSTQLPGAPGTEILATGLLGLIPLIDYILGQPKQPTQYSDQLSKGQVPVAGPDLEDMKRKVEKMAEAGTLPTIHTDCEAHAHPPPWWTKPMPEYMTHAPDWATHGLADSIYEPYLSLFLEAESNTSDVLENSSFSSPSGPELVSHVTEQIKLSRDRLRTLEHIVQVTNHLTWECHENVL